MAIYGPPVPEDLMLHGPAGDDYLGPSEDEIRRRVGPEPSFPELPELDFEASPYERILENMARGMQGTQAPRARNFWEGLAIGGVQGLAGGGAQVASRRQRFEERQAKRRLLYDDERRKAGEKYGESKRDAIKDAFKEHATAKQKREEREFEYPIVTQQMVDKLRLKNPEGASQLESIIGEPIPRASLVRAQMGPTESEKRAEAQLKLSNERAERAERAEERRIRLDEIKMSTDKALGIHRLISDRRQDKAIQTYENGLKFYRQGVAAANQNNGIGDHALIFAYMRAREPDNPNVVREGEYKTAEQAVGALQNVALKASLKKFLRGDKLLPAGREMMLDMMRADVDSARPEFEMADRQYKNIALFFGITNPDEYFTRHAEPPDLGRPGRGATVDPLTRQRTHQALRGKGMVVN